MDSRRIRILEEFRPFLRLLRAYNRKKLFCNKIHSVFYAIFTTLLIPLLPIVIILSFWYLFENGGDLRKIVVGLPVILSLALSAITFIALIIKNQLISETINEVQKAINQRKLFILLF